MQAFIISHILLPLFAILAYFLIRNHVSHILKSVFYVYTDGGKIGNTAIKWICDGIYSVIILVLFGAQLPDIVAKIAGSQVPPVSNGIKYQSFSLNVTYFGFDALISLKKSATASSGRFWVFACAKSRQYKIGEGAFSAAEETFQRTAEVRDSNVVLLTIIEMDGENLASIIERWSLPDNKRLSVPKLVYGQLECPDIENRSLI